MRFRSHIQFLEEVVSAQAQLMRRHVSRFISPGDEFTVYRVLEIVRGQAGLLWRHWLHPSARLHPTSVSSPESFSSGTTLEVE